MLNKLFAALMTVIMFLGTTSQANVSTVSTREQASVIESTQTLTDIANSVVTPAPSNKDQSSQTRITADQAEEIVFADIGLVRDQITLIETEPEREKGILLWEVELYHENTRYEYLINAETGAILQKKVKQKNSSALPKPSTDPVTEGITKDRALEIALGHAGLTKDQVTKLKIEKDREDGALVYEVEFRADLTEYDYNIDALSGEILKHEKETKAPNTQTKPTPQPKPSTDPITEGITRDKALEIALAHAGLTKDQVTKLKIEKDREDGALVYEVEFRADLTEYDYNIDALSGEILKHEKETKAPNTQTKPTPLPKPSTDPVTEGITKDKALEIALAHAGLTKDQVTKLKIEKDREDGALVYEVEFRLGRKEYEYEVRVSDGVIIKWDEEYDD